MNSPYIVTGGTSNYKLPTLEVSDNSECALDIPGNVCSTKKTVDAMKKTLKEKAVNEDVLNDKQTILNTVKKEFKCDTEECVLQRPEIRKHAGHHEIVKSMERIKPKGPANSTELLNNFNIDDVLDRLAKTHDKFYHMKFQMIDFAGEKDSNGNWKIKGSYKITPTALGKIDIAKDVLGKGYKTFSVVMNTDVRTGGGIHWFSLFIDGRTCPVTIEYFNSSGNLPVKNIQDWIIKTGENLKSAKYNVKPVILHGLVHQQSETECGLYSLYYIWNRLNGVPAERFQDKKVPDDMMYKFRKKCFKH